MALPVKRDKMSRREEISRLINLISDTETLAKLETTAKHDREILMYEVKMMRDRLELLDKNYVVVDRPGFRVKISPSGCSFYVTINTKNGRTSTKKVEWSTMTPRDLYKIFDVAYLAGAGVKK